jgi:DNA-binding transcriptional MerR regulator
LTQEEGLNLAGVRMIVDMEDRLDRMRREIQAMDKELRKARQQMQAEMDRLHRQYLERSEAGIVPLSQVRAVQFGLRRSAVRRPEPVAGQRRGPIPAGPAGHGS